VSGVEGVALALGAAVVKSSCKVWLGDRSVAADASASAVDLVVARVAGVVEQRRVRRLFDQMEEVVAERLRPLLEHEFRHLPGNERLAATDAVRATFDRAGLTNEDLFAADLDAGYIDRYLRRLDPAVPARYALSAGGTAFYDRLLRECCAYLVQITTTLPEFQPGVLTELLRRDSEILGMLKEMLARLPERRGARDFEVDYRQQVATALDRMTFFGATLPEASRRYPLSVAYVSLAVAGRTLADLVPGSGPLAEERSRPLASSFRMEEILPHTTRLFVRGEAGSGKTTLLQWLAVRCASGDLPAEDWAGTVPFFIRLRRYADQALPTPGQFLSDVGRHIADEMPAGWVHQRLRSGRAAILVDGVDELPEQRREEARRWLRELTATFPAARYVVTARPAAAPPTWLRDDHFAVAELLPMTPSDVRAFIHRWHEANRAAQVDAVERHELDSYERNLSKAVTTSRALRRLAENPLLCALLCALHRDRRGQLPRSRMELYEVALHMLLERRDRERGIEQPDGLSRTEKTLLLQDIAYWLVRNGWSDAPSERVATRIQARIASMPQIRADAQQIFRHLLERSGLLREPVTGRTSFVHRTFQEYLAAGAAIAADDIGVLAENAHLDQWRDVVVMAAGHASLRQREELLSGLIRHDSASQRRRAYLNLLAMACLETSPELSRELQAEIKGRVRRLLPPRNTDAAAAVAAAGDFVLDLLVTSQPQSAQQTAATIRAAAEIGGETALQVIARFGADRREAVVKELAAAWPRFDPVAYADTVLRDSPLLAFGAGRGALAINDPALVPALGRLQGLQHLECRFSQRHGDLGFAARLPGLTSLLIADPALSDLTPLRGTRLTRLIVLPAQAAAGPPLALAPLTSVPTLTRLDLLVPTSGWPDLAALPSLTGLQLAGTGDAERLAQLKGLPALELVGLRDITGLTGLAPLGFLTGPKWFGLHNCPDLHDLGALARWAPSLQRLWLKDCGEADFSPLSTLHGLDLLDLSGQAPSDLSVLSGLRRLHTLRLVRQATSPDLAPLRDLPSLRRLWLYHSGDIDLAPLAGKAGLVIYLGRDQQVHGAGLLGPGSRVRRR
jgi:NACHT conflict system protein/NACHT domain-containing protein